MPMFSSKNSEKYKMIKPGDIWGDSCFSRSFKFVYMRLVRRLRRRDYTQSVTQKNTLFIFRVSNEKNPMHTTEKMSFHGVSNIFETRIRLESSALAMKRPRSPPCYAMYYYLWIFLSSYLTSTHLTPCTLHSLFFWNFIKIIPDKTRDL